MQFLYKRDPAKVQCGVTITWPRICMYIYTYNMDIYTYTIAGVKFSRVSFPCAGMDQCGVTPQYICIYKYIDVGIDIYNASIYIYIAI